jgi:hypothetical protein
MSQAQEGNGIKRKFEYSDSEGKEEFLSVVDLTGSDGKEGELPAAPAGLGVDVGVGIGLPCVEDALRVLLSANTDDIVRIVTDERIVIPEALASSKSVFENGNTISYSTALYGIEDFSTRLKASVQKARWAFDAYLADICLLCGKRPLKKDCERCICGSSRICLVCYVRVCESSSTRGCSSTDTSTEADRVDQQLAEEADLTRCQQCKELFCPECDGQPECCTRRQLCANCINSTNCSYDLQYCDMCSASDVCQCGKCCDPTVADYG